MANDILKQTQAAIAGVVNDLQRKKMDADRQTLISSINGALGPLLMPYLNQIVQNSASGSGQIRQAVSEAMGELKSGIRDALSNLKLESIVHDIKIPEIQAPNIPDVRVNIDTTGIEAAVTRAIQNIKINIPPVTVPPVVMPERMNVSMADVSNQRPLSVRAVDEAGKPVMFSMGGGGKMDFLTIKSIMASAFGDLVNPDGRLLVQIPTGSSGLTDAEIRATALPVSQVSGASWSVSVVDVFGSVGANVINPDNRIKVELPTGASGLTDTELRATAVPVSQLSGANWSVSVTDIFGSVGTDVVNPDGRIKVELPTGSSGLTDAELRATAVPVSQLSGARWSTEATQSGTWNIGTVTTVTAVTDVTNSLKAALIDSSGVQYSGTNPVPTTIISSSVVSTIAVGPVASDAADDGSAPVKTGGIARQANPTAVSAGDTVSASFDDLGRQVMRPVQVRDLITTAYVSLTNGTETTLLAGASSTFHDLIYVMAANQSDAAVLVDLRCGTGGEVVMSLQVPASGTAGVSLQVPHPMPEVAQAWTADMGDITGTTVDITAQFSKEV